MFKTKFKQTINSSMVVIIGVVTYFILSNLSHIANYLLLFLQIIRPIVIALMMAYVLNLIMRFIENRLPSKIKAPKLRRTASLIITFSLVFAIISGFVIILLPKLIDNVSSLIGQIPPVEQVEVMAKNQLRNMNLPDWLMTEISQSYSKAVTSIVDWLYQMTGYATNFVAGAIASLLSLFLSLVLAIYILASKENLILTTKKLIYASLPKTKIDKIENVVVELDRSFAGFIQGQVTEAIILGTLCYIGMLILGFEYSLLISSIICLTSVIPFFGPYIGGVIAIILLAIFDPMMAVYFAIYLVILQQFEGNVIYPKVIGKSVGLSGFWVIVAVTVGMNSFGLFGIVISIPLMSTIYKLSSRKINQIIAERKIKIS